MGVRDQVRRVTSARELWLRSSSPALLLASGFAGLGYQIVWTQKSSLWLGHESAAVLAVISAFFGGLAAGGLALGERIERSERPLRWYVGCELVVALWSLLLVFVWAPFGGLVARAIGVEPSAGWHWFAAFAGTFVLFLPATAAMGATLPAMERITAQLGQAGRSLAGLYAANTFGAVLGVLAVAFVLIPALGLAGSAGVCVALNLACAVSALLAFPRRAEVRSSLATATDPARARAALWRLALSGLLGIGYEVVVVRVLSQVTENTVYTFAMLLAVYLVGSAAGAAAYRRFERSHAGEQLTHALWVALALACLVGTATLYAAESLRNSLLAGFGASLTGAVAVEAALAVAAFGLPTLVMGALFVDLCRAASAAGVGLGRALGVNTLAGAVAPLVFGVVLVPWLGPKSALVLVAVGYLLGTPRGAWTTSGHLLPAAAAVAVAIGAPPLRFIDVPPAGRVVTHEEGVAAAVSVVESAEGVRTLHINNRQQEGSNVTRYVDARQAWLPLLLHPAPRRALFLGLGTGVTASAAAEDPALEVDAVELLPEVIAASGYFRGSGEGAPRWRALAADARRYVRASNASYDVIVSDNFHPARSGSGALYTVEHFAAVRERLSARGLFCQWLPLHQLDLHALKYVVRAFLAVFPRGSALLASNSLETPVLGLVARKDGGRFDVAAARQRLTQPALAERLAGLALDDELALFGSFVAGPLALERFARGVRANTDDWPVVAYRAPRVTYAPPSLPRERLLALLGELSARPGELTSPPPDPNWSRRLSAYWSARDRYLDSGKQVRPSGNVEQMLAQVREPLLSVLRISPDFRPAYDPLVSMAAALARTNVLGARALLVELTKLQPSRTEASRLLFMLHESATIEVGTH
jgi:spermidine synthase